MTAEYEKEQGHKIWQYCADLLSIYSREKLLSSVVFRENVFWLVGTMIIYSKSFSTPKCDYPGVGVTLFL